MVFKSFIFEDGTIIKATAQGHPDEVVIAFRSICSIIFSDLGAWRITKVSGRCPSDTLFDSDMEWKLRAEKKS